MQCTIREALDKIEQMDGLITRLDNGSTIGVVDLEIIRDLLSDYREILLNTKVNI